MAGKAGDAPAEQSACLLVATIRQDRVRIDVSEPSYKAMVETLLDRLR